jgi:hypothetical protein
MNATMRSAIVAVLLVVAGCTGGDGGAPDPTAPRTYEFGPFTVAAGEEVSRTCVQISLNNDDFLYINSVELTTGPGFHHSNWFFVPDHVFAGEDGTFTCADRDFNEPVAAIFGGVLFAQSTQAPHEVQAFPEGVVIKIPPGSKLVTQIHLLNATESPQTLAPTITLEGIREQDVTTTLAGVSFQNKALLLPPSMSSRFTIECDLQERHNYLFGRDPDFKFYYALAHYHELGTKMTLEAVKPDGARAVVYSTEDKPGDVLGGAIDPLFDMTGYTKLRLSCEYYNPRSQSVGYGIGDQEMCVFLAFSDSTYNWGGGVNEETAPTNPVMDGNMMTYSNACAVYANDATR